MMDVRSVRIRGVNAMRMRNVGEVPGTVVEARIGVTGIGTTTIVGGMTRIGKVEDDAAGRGTKKWVG